MKRKWRFKLSVNNVVLMIICFCINFIGRMLASALELPFWLDSIGTCFSAISLGPLGGVIVGMLTNIASEIFIGSSLPYIIVSIAIAIVAGSLYPEDNEFFQVVFTAILISIVAITLSTPLNLYFYGGLTGNKWGDALFSMLCKNGLPNAVSCVFAQAFTDIPDKAITLLMISGVIKLKNKKANREETNA